MGSNFMRRLKYYGIGFGIGCIFVFFFFKGRGGCTWTPSNRVKSTILGRALVVSEADQLFMENKNLTQKDVISFLNDGDIDFSKSKKDGNPKVYVIEKEIENKGFFSACFTIPDESYISEVKFAVSDPLKVVNSKKGIASVLRFPVEKDLVFIDTIAMKSCAKDWVRPLNDDILFDAMKTSAQIDFSKSNFEAKPRSEQRMIFTYNQKEVEANTFWYQDKINVNAILTESIKECEAESTND